MKSSLRRRLLTLLVSLILLVWLVSVGFAALLSREVVLRQIDERLQRYADMAEHTLAAVFSDPAVQSYFESRASLTRGSPFTRVTGMSGSQEQTINLWFDDSQILLGEESLRFPGPTQAGLFTESLGSGEDPVEWRIIYRYLATANVWLGVGVDLDHARANGAATFWQLMIPLLILMPITAGLLFVAVGRGLKPLNTLAASIAARKPHALSPIDIGDTPRELEPVVLALNNLLAKLERALASESRFTANAAHELQTPLSAIKAEVQRYQRIETDADTRTMLQRIETRVRRSADTVQQLLTLARLDPDQEFALHHVDISELLLDVIAELAGLAHDRGLELDLEISPDIELRGNTEWLRILLRNLIVNAFKYANSGTNVGISLQHDKGCVELKIDNACEPLSSEECGRLGERFYRPEGQLASGVGLGLSIVRRIAELHGASVSLGLSHSGSRFEALVRW